MFKTESRVISRRPNRLSKNSCRRQFIVIVGSVFGFGYVVEGDCLI